MRSASHRPLLEFTDDFTCQEAKNRHIGFFRSVWAKTSPRWCLQHKLVKVGEVPCPPRALRSRTNLKVKRNKSNAKADKVHFWIWPLRWLCRTSHEFERLHLGAGPIGGFARKKKKCFAPAELGKLAANCATFKYSNHQKVCPLRQRFDFAWLRLSVGLRPYWIS